MADESDEAKRHEARYEEWQYVLKDHVHVRPRQVILDIDAVDEGLSKESDAHGNAYDYHRHKESHHELADRSLMPAPLGNVEHA